MILEEEGKRDIERTVASYLPQYDVPDKRGITLRMLLTHASGIKSNFPLWKDAKGREILGFAARTFDVPTLIQRSRLLGVEHRAINLARYGKGHVIDLREILTFDDARYEAIMPRSLKMFCKRFGIPCDDGVNGADVPALIQDGNWDAVISHVTSDVRLTMALARRIGVLEAEQVGA